MFIPLLWEWPPGGGGRVITILFLGTKWLDAIIPLILHLVNPIMIMPIWNIFNCQVSHHTLLYVALIFYLIWQKALLFVLLYGIYSVKKKVMSIGVGRGSGGANDPLWKRIFEIDREIPLTRIFFKNWPWKSVIFDKTTPPLQKRPPSANPGYAYDVR
jgi:hypothetical protein